MAGRGNGRGRGRAVRQWPFTRALRRSVAAVAVVGPVLAAGAAKARTAPEPSVWDDPERFRALAEQAPRLPDSTRLKLLSDTWSFASNGRMGLEEIVARLADAGDARGLPATGLLRLGSGVPRATRERLAAIGPGASSA